MWQTEEDRRGQKRTDRHSCLEKALLALKSTNFCGPAIRTLSWFWAMVWSKWTKIWVDICDTLGKYRPIMVIWAITLLVFKKKSTGDHPRLVNNFSQKRLEGFLSFFAWMFRTIIARNAHGGFSEKIPVFWIIAKMCYFRGFSSFFSETALSILLKLGQNVLCMITDHLQKTACQNLFHSRDLAYWKPSKRQKMLFYLQDSSDSWSEGSKE